MVGLLVGLHSEKEDFWSNSGRSEIGLKNKKRAASD
jgi:hypothetical protein